jgi:hypothetical protein
MEYQLTMAANSTLWYIVGVIALGLTIFIIREFYLTRRVTGRALTALGIVVVIIVAWAADMPAGVTREVPQTATPSLIVPTAVGLRFQWEVIHVCDEEPDVVQIRVHNSDLVDLEVTGFIKAEPDSGKEKTISEIPSHDRHCPSQAWCGPQERIRNHYPQGFFGKVWGTVWVHYQGEVLDTKSFGPVRLTCQ